MYEVQITVCRTTGELIDFLHNTYPGGWRVASMAYNAYNQCVVVMERPKTQAPKPLTAERRNHSPTQL